MLDHQSFLQLSTEVKKILDKQSWFQRYGMEILFLLIRVVLFVLSFWIFSQPGWGAKIIGMLLISYNFYGIAITGTHEAGHRSWSSSILGNKIWGYFFSDFW